MNPLTFFRRRSDEQLVDAGRVHCPAHRRDVDVEACAACGWAVEIQPAAKPGVVRCRPPQAPRLLRGPWA